MPDPTTNLDDLATDEHYVADGFAGQRLSVLPAKVVSRALRSPVLEQLLVTDCGYFPRALHHGFSRPQGGMQTIIILCTAGQGIVEVGDTSCPVAAGDIAIIPAHQQHSYSAVPTDPWTIWWLHVTGSLLDSLGELSGLSIDRPVSRTIDLVACSSLMREVVDYHSRDYTTSSLVLAASAAWRLIALIATSEISQKSADSPISGVITHLQEHTSEHLSLSEMADLAGLSPSRFAALFREQTGTSPLRYQVAQRMRRARELLDLTDMPVSRIASSLGYADHFYFTRQFTKEHGMAPRDYRKRAKG